MAKPKPSAAAILRQMQMDVAAIKKELARQTLILKRMARPKRKKVSGKMVREAPAGISKRLGGVLDAD